LKRAAGEGFGKGEVRAKCILINAVVVVSVTVLISIGFDIDGSAEFPGWVGFGVLIMG
jgi:hypothetical protein